MIAYLGPQGTFSQLAAEYWLQQSGIKGKLIPFSTIPESLWALKRHEVDYAVVPVENSIEGAVSLTWDILAAEKMLILAEVVLPIDHNLVGRCSLAEAKVVYSHPQALAQCRGFLEQRLNGVLIQQTSSTSEAALKASREERALAISSSQAAQIYGLKTIAASIQDFKDNKTRFVVTAWETALPDAGEKTSLVLALPKNKPGGLFEVLKEFAGENINLTRIESRPTKKELGDYLFFIDCMGHFAQEPLALVLQRLTPKTVLLKVLGSYPVFQEVRQCE